MALIDRIGRTDPIDTSALNNRKVTEKDSSDAASFHLPNEEYEGVYYEPEEKEAPPKTWAQINDEIAAEERAAAKQNLHSRFDGPGVEVELSTDSVRRAYSQTQTNQSAFEGIRKVWENIKKFFSDLWNGDSESPKAFAEMTETTASIEIPDFLKSTKEGEVPATTERPNFAEKQASAENIAAFMVDYGGRKLAKNSDLLTQYDRTGKIVTPNASDKRRILQGDGKTRKYY